MWKKERFIWNHFYHLFITYIYHIFYHKTPNKFNILKYNTFKQKEELAKEQALAEENKAMDLEKTNEEAKEDYVEVADLAYSSSDEGRYGNFTIPVYDIDDKEFVVDSLESLYVYLSTKFLYDKNNTDEED